MSKVDKLPWILLSGNKMMRRKKPILKACSLINLAPTPEALSFEAKAKTLSMDLENSFQADSKRRITVEDVKSLDASVQQIFNQLKKLPKLSPEQVQKELMPFLKKSCIVSGMNREHR